MNFSGLLSGGMSDLRIDCLYEGNGHLSRCLLVKRTLNSNYISTIKYPDNFFKPTYHFALVIEAVNNQSQQSCIGKKKVTRGQIRMEIPYR